MKYTFEKAKKRQNVRVSKLGAGVSDEELVSFTLADVSG